MNGGAGALTMKTGAPALTASAPGVAKLLQALIGMEEEARAAAGLEAGAGGPDETITVSRRVPTNARRQSSWPRPLSSTPVLTSGQHGPQAQEGRRQDRQALQVVRQRPAAGKGGYGGS